VDPVCRGPSRARLASRRCEESTSALGDEAGGGTKLPPWVREAGGGGVDSTVRMRVTSASEVVPVGSGKGARLMIPDRRSKRWGRVAVGRWDSIAQHKSTRRDSGTASASTAARLDRRRERGPGWRALGRSYMRCFRYSIAADTRAGEQCKDGEAAAAATAAATC
jgi:hypothetical protein